MMSSSFLINTNIKILYEKSFHMNFNRLLCTSTKKQANKRIIKLINKEKSTKGMPMKKRLNITDHFWYGPKLPPNEERKNVTNANLMEAERSFFLPNENSNVNNIKSGINFHKTITDSLSPNDTNCVTKSSSSVSDDAQTGDSLPKYEVNESFDINIIQSFPLFNSEKDGLGVSDSSSNEITSISIFEGGYKRIPNVHKVLNETMPPERKLILENWEKKMIKKLGEEGFQNYRQGLLDRGKIFHECIGIGLTEETGPSSNQLVGIEDLWLSIKNTLPEITNIKMIESRVMHPELHYQGSVDCVATYKNLPVVIEFKSSSKPKLTLNSTYDDPLQLVAYLGALNYDTNYSLPQTDGALLVIAYPTGLPAHVHYISKEVCIKYWNMWRQRLHQFWKINKEFTSPVIS